MKIKSPIHLLLRFSDSLLKDSDTIEAHNQVVSSAGAVWFGKMGSPVSRHYIEIINDQIEKGVPTYVYLVKGNRRKSSAYRSRLIAISNTMPEDERQMVPLYYYELGLTRYMKFWVKLTEIAPITSADLSNMRVASSVLPIQETISKSSTGHFFLVEDKHLF